MARAKTVGIAPASELDDAAVRRINALLSKMRGVKLSRWRALAAGELFLEFGRLARAGNYPHGPARFRAPWLVRCRATPVVIRAASPARTIKMSGDDPPDTGALGSLLGLKVMTAAIRYPSLALQLAFARKMELRITPTMGDASDTLSYWDVRLPDDRVISVGPGAQWMLSKGYEDPIERPPARWSTRHLRALVNGDDGG
jgi:hypothetical protein